MKCSECQEPQCGRRELIGALPLPWCMTRQQMVERQRQEEAMRREEARRPPSIFAALDSRWSDEP